MGSGDAMWFRNNPPSADDYTLEEGPTGLAGPWKRIGGPNSYAKIREQLAKIAMSGKKERSYRILDAVGKVANVYDPANNKE